MKWFWRTLLTLSILGLVGLIVVYIVNRHVYSVSGDKIKLSVAEIPAEDEPRVAIVLGARVRNGGELSDALYDRVFTAVELYKAGKVKKILMSGDNPSHDYDEPTAMKNAAVELGVAESDIVLDFAGRRTYDTCYRAKEIFEVKRAILVSQEFHLARSVYLCENLGVESIAVKADRREYLGSNRWAVREFFSIFSAWFELNFISFEPIKGKKEPIEQ